MRYKIAESDSMNHVYFSGSDMIVGLKKLKVLCLPYLEILVVYVTF